MTEHLERRDDQHLRRALRAVLLFHGSGAWDDEKREAWMNLTGHEEATTKSLCDTVRAALREDQP